MRALQKAGRSNPDIKIYDVEKMKQSAIYNVQRVYQHKNGVFKGFASRYGCKIIVYYELFDSMKPYWEDLYESIF